MFQEYMWYKISANNAKFPHCWLYKIKSIQWEHNCWYQLPYKWNQCKASLGRRQRGWWKNVFGCFCKGQRFWWNNFIHCLEYYTDIHILGILFWKETFFCNDIVSVYILAMSEQHVDCDFFFFFFFNDTVLKLSSEGIDMNMGNFLKVHCEARVLETTANRLMCSR